MPAHGPTLNEGPATCKMRPQGAFTAGGGPWARRKRFREECSSMARAPVSKTGGCGFESLHSCHLPSKTQHFRAQLHRVATRLFLVATYVTDFVTFCGPFRYGPGDSFYS